MDGIRYQEYTAYEGQTVFDVDFTVYDVTGLNIKVGAVILGPDDYTFNSTTSKITLDSGASEGDKVAIWSGVTGSRLYSFGPEQKATPDALNLELDAMSAAVEEIRRDVSGAIRLPVGKSGGQLDPDALGPDVVLLAFNPGTGAFDFSLTSELFTDPEGRFEFLEQLQTQATLSHIHSYTPVRPAGAPDYQPLRDLDLDFRTGRYFVGGVQKTDLSGYFTRSSVATTWAKDGGFTEAAINDFRIMRDIYSGAPIGLLMEGATTNLATTPDNLSGWVLQDVDRTTGAAAGPFGAGTMTLFEAAAGTNSLKGIRDDIDITGGEDYFMSGYVKEVPASPSDKIRLDADTSSIGASVDLYLDLAYGTAPTKFAETEAYDIDPADRAGAHWFWCQYTADSSESGADFFIRPSLQSEDHNFETSSPDPEAFYLSHVMITNELPSTWIAGTRAADTLVFDDTDIPITAAQGTIEISYAPMLDMVEGSECPVILDDGTTDNYYAIERDPSSPRDLNIYARREGGSEELAASFTGILNPHSLKTIRLSWRDGRTWASVDGVPAASQQLSAPAVLNRLRFDADKSSAAAAGVAGALFGHVKYAGQVQPYSDVIVEMCQSGRLIIPSLIPLMLEGQSDAVGFIGATDGGTLSHPQVLGYNPDTDSLDVARRGVRPYNPNVHTNGLTPQCIMHAAAVGLATVSRSTVIYGKSAFGSTAVENRLVEYVQRQIANGDPLEAGLTAAHAGVTNYFDDFRTVTEAMLAKAGTSDLMGVGISLLQGNSVVGANDPLETTDSAVFLARKKLVHEEIRRQTWFNATRPIIEFQAIKNGVQSDHNAVLATLNADADPWVGCVTSEALENPLPRVLLDAGFGQLMQVALEMLPGNTPRPRSYDDIHHAGHGLHRLGLQFVLMVLQMAYENGGWR